MKDLKILHSNWLAGFYLIYTSGEGYFSVRLKKSSNHKLGFQVLFNFKLT